MQPNLYYQLKEIQNLHWWHQGRRLLVRSCLGRLKATKMDKGLDLGCGTGGNLNLLKGYCQEVVGFDYSHIALEIARKKYPQAQLIQGNANHLGNCFAAESFDLVTVFNVIYHRWVTNDLNVLKQAYDVLSPGGILVITEPACKFLMRRHDDLDMGKTRYSLPELKQMVQEAGFVIDQASYFNLVSFLPALVLKTVESFAPKDKKQNQERVTEIEVPPKWLNNLMFFILKAETAWIKAFGRLPIGLGVMCIAHKPK